MPDIKNKVKSLTDFFKAPVDYFYDEAAEPSEDTLGEDKPSLEFQEQVTPSKGKYFLPKNPRKKTTPEPSEEKDSKYYTYEFDPTYGEVKIYEYTPQYPFPRMGELGVDHSLVTLQYLQSMGYKRAIWMTDDAHVFFSHHNKCGVDPCEENNGKQFYIDELIQHAHQHSGGGQYVCDMNNVRKLQRREQKINQLYNNKWYKIPLKEIAKLQKEIENIKAGTKVEKWNPYSPPSPIFSNSHPGCICHLLCLDPLSLNDIPDNAPGMPIFADPKIKQEFKQRIWDNIMALPSAGIEIHAYTLPPDPNSSFTEEVILNNQDPEGKLFASYEERKKFAEERWVSDIKPIITSNNVYMKYPIGIIQPVMQGLKGFQLKVNNNLSLVYLVDMNHLVYVPKEHIKYINFSNYETPSSIQRGDFIRIDEGTLGIVFNVTFEDQVLAYIPDFEEIISIDEFEKLI